MALQVLALSFCSVYLNALRPLEDTLTPDQLKQEVQEAAEVDGVEAVDTVAQGLCSPENKAKLCAALGEAKRKAEEQVKKKWRKVKIGVALNTASVLSFGAAEYAQHTADALANAPLEGYEGFHTMADLKKAVEDGSFVFDNNDYWEKVHAHWDAYHAWADHVGAMEAGSVLVSGLHGMHAYNAQTPIPLHEGYPTCLNQARKKQYEDSERWMKNAETGAKVASGVGLIAGVGAAACFSVALASMVASAGVLAPVAGVVMPVCGTLASPVAAGVALFNGVSKTSLQAVSMKMSQNQKNLLQEEIDECNLKGIEVDTDVKVEEDLSKAKSVEEWKQEAHAHAIDGGGPDSGTFKGWVQDAQGCWCHESKPPSSGGYRNRKVDGWTEDARGCWCKDSTSLAASRHRNADLTDQWRVPRGEVDAGKDTRRAWIQDSGGCWCHKSTPPTIVSSAERNVNTYAQREGDWAKDSRGCWCPAHASFASEGHDGSGGMDDLQAPDRWTSVSKLCWCLKGASHVMVSEAQSFDSKKHLYGWNQVSQGCWCFGFAWKWKGRGWNYDDWERTSTKWSYDGVSYEAWVRDSHNRWYHD
eukprot:TRINITY_DN22859_c0_g7_i1.p1 TRINITY_DN22859_c0_g7~~TRINITY_DN22859_c0_g7_i1.p1  ORF type:complete len:586 (-),score=79.03 TRINITY_DN22859_c0_g7_i1:362-2119(-)